jgi:hypothetical protein
VTEYEIATVDNEVITYSITDFDQLEHSWSRLLVPCCAIEIGRYGDMVITNALTGKRLWVGASVDMTENLYKAIERLMKVAEKLKFLGDAAIHS